VNNDSKKRKCIIVSICLVIVLAIISCVFIKKNISNDNNYKTTEKNKDTATKTEVVDKTTEVVTTEKAGAKDKESGSISGGVKKDKNTKGNKSDEGSDDKNNKTPGRTTEGTTEYAGSTEEPTTQRQADNDDGSTKKPPKKDEGKKDDDGKKEPETTQAPVTPENPDKPDKPAKHVHTWKDCSKEHPAVTHDVTKRVLVKEAWDEEKTTKVKHWFCGGCNMDFTAAGCSMDNITIHTDSCKGGSSYYFLYVPVTETVHHDAVYEDRTVTVTDKEAWTEHWKECTTCGAIEK
jgi:hypothetical protein